MDYLDRGFKALGFVGELNDFQGLLDLGFHNVQGLGFLRVLGLIFRVLGFRFKWFYSFKVTGFIQIFRVWFVEVNVFEGLYCQELGLRVKYIFFRALYGLERRVFRVKGFRVSRSFKD